MFMKLIKARALYEIINNAQLRAHNGGTGPRWRPSSPRGAGRGGASGFGRRCGFGASKIRGPGWVIFAGRLLYSPELLVRDCARNIFPGRPDDTTQPDFSASAIFGGTDWPTNPRCTISFLCVACDPVPGSIFTSFQCSVPACQLEAASGPLPRRSPGGGRQTRTR